MIQYRREGDMIPTGLSWSWIGGPSFNWMNKSRTRRVYLRIRAYVKLPDGYRFRPGFWAELLTLTEGKCSTRGVVWNWLR
jgi:hypothetical protein